MKQQEFAAIVKVEECDLAGIQKCDWCNVWKPAENIRGKIFGTLMCTNCYYNFLNMTMNKELIEKLIEFCQRRLLKNGNGNVGFKT